MEPNYIIDGVATHWGQIPVNLVFSYGRVEHFPFVMVRLRSQGVEGIGEAMVPPNDFYHRFLPTLLSQDARKLDALLPATDNDHDRILCEAVSMAFYDLVGRISRLPLHALLGGKKRKCVPLMPCIFPTDAEDAAEKAGQFCRQGYHYLKIKLAGNLDQDLARVQAVRSVIPSGAGLQGDANEGYQTVSEARTAIERLGQAGLDIFEDPLKGGVREYSELRGGAGAKIMVDALARRTEDLVSVLQAGAADMIGIHPDQPGSLSRVLEHVALAKSFSVPFIIGGTGYLGIGSAVYQHLTAVASSEGPCGELGGAFDHGMPFGLVRAPLPMKDGAVDIPDTPGTGVELDEVALKKVEAGFREWR